MNDDSKMQRLTIDYITGNKFIINERYWIYFDGNLYIYDNECKLIGDKKEWSTYNKRHSLTSFCSSKFESFAQYCDLIKNKHPLITSKEYNAYTYQKSERNTFLKTLLWDHLYHTSYVYNVYGYYKFSSIQKGNDSKRYIITHDEEYHGKKFDVDENSNMIKKYLDDNQLETYNSEFKFLGKNMFDLVNVGFSTYEYK